jgi:hypothetical protein
MSERCHGCGAEASGRELTYCGTCDCPIHPDCASPCDACGERTCDGCMGTGGRDDLVCAGCATEESWERSGPLVEV